MRMRRRIVPPKVAPVDAASSMLTCCHHLIPWIAGDSLEDLESMRLSSASFAAALAEAEAIAANVAASMAAAHQQRQLKQAQAAAAAAAVPSAQQSTADVPDRCAAAAADACCAVAKRLA